MTESAAELSAAERTAMYATYRKCDSDGLAAVYLLGIQAALADPARAHALTGTSEVTGFRMQHTTHIDMLDTYGQLLHIGSPRSLQARITLRGDEGEE